jgi:phosphoglycerate kinase
LNKKTIRDIDIEGKRVLVRVDFNVPLDIITGTITDDSRIQAALPTINYLIEHNAKLILCSHLGRPHGEVVEELRTARLANRLSQLIDTKVVAVSESVGPQVEQAANKLQSRQVLFLENVRFHPQEEANDPVYAKSLAKLAEIYVNDAFGTAHRAHASNVGVARYLPAVAGFLVEKELNALSGIISNPEHPFAALLGGAKVSDKIGLIVNILHKLDMLLIGGGMAATFLTVKGCKVGLSSIEDNKVDIARKLVADAGAKGISLLLPVDVMVTDSISNESTGEVVAISNIPNNRYIVDIGPRTIELFKTNIKSCATIFWNGPMGVCEIPQFASGTREMVKLLSELNATTVIGGGSTAEIVEEMHLSDKMTHVSTGGGASLKFMEGKDLPGVAVLLDK